MARTANATAKTKSTGAKRQASRSSDPARKTPAAKTTAAKTAAKTAKPETGAKRAAGARAVPGPSKEELRAQVEKLEQANATLRAKQREAGRGAKQSAARIAELEAQVAELEQKVASAAKPAKPATKPAKRASRRSRDIDPGDAVPAGVAVQEPEPLDQEAETALDNLDEHLGPE